MSASRISSSALGDIRQIVASIRQHVAQGTTEKLIEDENFVFQMLKVRFEDKSSWRLLQYFSGLSDSLETLAEFHLLLTTSSVS